ncbi:hypothetical protein GCM10023083_60220 [Streptomyces phyllanthi]
MVRFSRGSRVFWCVGVVKDGDASACMSRQYTGTAGKVTNCQVGVSPHLARERASAARSRRYRPGPG